MTTVKKLKEMLENLPDEMEIFLQDDSEGNGYKQVSGIDSDCVRISDDYAYEVEIYSTRWSADDADMDEEEWEEIKNNNPKVLVIHP